MKPNAGSRLLSFQLHHSEKRKVIIYRYVQPAMLLGRELKAACVLGQICWIVGQTISQIAFPACWAPETILDSSVVPSFLLGKLGEQTGQLWRDNSCRVRTHEKNSGDAVWRLGAIIQSIFLCPIRNQHSLDRLEMVRWKSVPRGSSAHAWKLSSRLLTRPD